MYLFPEALAGLALAWAAVALAFSLAIFSWVLAFSACNSKACSPVSLVISKVPSVERDLALVMDQSVAVGEVVDAIYRCDKNRIKKVSVFDVYIGDKIESGKKSVAVRITLESLDTLTDEVINQKMKKILNTLAYCYKIEIRK